MQLGLFFLASSALVAAMCLLVSLVLSSWRAGIGAYGRDPLNRWLLLTTGLMLVGAAGSTSGALAWLGLFNWIPFFWGFWGWQPYLLDPAARQRCIGCLLAGSVPVVVTGLGQLLLGWEGPWSIVSGLIVWHVDAGGQPDGRLSGLFDYANIAAAWLALSWPLLLGRLLLPGANMPGRILTVVLVLSHAVCLWLTASRNAWAAAVLAIPLVLGPGTWLWLLPVLLVVLLPLALSVFSWVPDALQVPARAIVPDSLWSRLTDSAFPGRPPASTRLGQWTVAVGLTLERPWLGWGAAAFSFIYPLRTGQWLGHPHNLPLELGVSFGAPVALLLLALPLWMVAVVLRRGMATANVSDRSWLVAFIILIGIHATDLPYYDSRLNIAGWFLLAGLRAFALAANHRSAVGTMSGSGQMDCLASSSSCRS